MRAVAAASAARPGSSEPLGVRQRAGALHTGQLASATADDERLTQPQLVQANTATTSPLELRVPGL